MLIYLDHALEDRRKKVAAEGRALTQRDLYAAIMEGAVELVRPKMMTVVAIMAGLLPILWIHGTASEVMHCCADDRRNGVIDHSDIGRHSGQQCNCER